MEVDNHDNSVRSTVPYTPDWKRYVMKRSSTPGIKHPYNFQYNQIYRSRLRKLRDRCIPSNDDSSIKVPRIIELNENLANQTIVGTLVKDFTKRKGPKMDVSSTYFMESFRDTSDKTEMPSLRSIVENKENMDENDADANQNALFLEDESGRVELAFSEENSNYEELLNTVDGLTTGVVVAITGLMTPGTGVIVVNDLYLPSLPPQDQLSINNTSDSKYVVLCSGLSCGSLEKSQDHGSLSLRRSMLIDYVAGHVDGTGGEASSIVRLIIAGGNCARVTKTKIHENSPRYTNNSNATMSVVLKDGTVQKSKTQFLDGDTTNTIIKTDMKFSIQELDLFISEICASGLPVSLLPGTFDPTNANMPQQPFHPCLLQMASRYGRVLERVTNPYEASLGESGVHLAGTDGRNIMDIQRYTCVSQKKTPEAQDISKDEEENATFISSRPLTSLEALEQSLRYSHIAPSGPDSLNMFPFPEGQEDPLLMEKCPHVYFAGNCPEYDTKLIDENNVKCRLICIPSFVETGEAVLLNLSTLEVKRLQFLDD